MQDFYDYDQRDCSFNSREFIMLLEEINKVEDGGPIIEKLDMRESLQRLLAGEILIYENLIPGMPEFLDLTSSFQDKAAWVGYPSPQGIHHNFRSFVLLGINSYSHNKEGAWAFLEYLLSQEVQSWSHESFRRFPVRKDAFLQYITSAPWIAENNVKQYASEEECRALQEMIDNTYLHTYNMENPILTIMLEECELYFSGAKSVEETAGMIQNRVLLYLSE